jgi:hypothetical protein
MDTERGESFSPPQPDGSVQRTSLHPKGSGRHSRFFQRPLWQLIAACVGGPQR